MVANAPAEPPKSVIRDETLVAAFERQVRERAALPALHFRAGGGYTAINWEQFGAAVKRAAAFLHGEGVTEQSHVAIWSNNRPEWHIADMGILSAHCRPVPIYQTLSPSQGAYVLNHSETAVLFIENGRFLQRVMEVRSQIPKLRRIVVLDTEGAELDGDSVISWTAALRRGEEVLKAQAGAVAARAANVGLDDIATLIYTSGTTGPPKAVQITHGNVVAANQALGSFIKAGPDDRQLSYLPLAHIAERLVSEFRSYVYGNPTWFLDGLENLGARLAEVQPTLFFGVPRVWEKLAAGVEQAISAMPQPRRAVARWALNVGERCQAHRAAGTPVTGLMARREALAEKLVFSKIRAQLGFAECKVFAVGAAPIDPNLLQWYRGIGMEICEEYGQTEVTAVASMNRPGHVKIGTVGPPCPGVEIRIADDGEILVRGGMVSPGYYKDDEATAAAFVDGWMHSGDLGRFDEDGYLVITGRKKDLIITAGGKNISPTNIEQLVRRHPLIAHVVVIGDRRPFITALITLDADTAPRWAREHGVSGDLDAIATSPVVLDEIARHVTEANRELSQVEQVKVWHLLARDFTMGDELTPSLKVKRNVVAERYAAEIDQMYAKAKKPTE